MHKKLTYNPQKPSGLVLGLLPFYRWWKRGEERLTALPKDTQLESAELGSEWASGFIHPASGGRSPHPAPGEFSSNFLLSVIHQLRGMGRNKGVSTNPDKCGAVRGVVERASSTAGLCGLECWVFNLLTLVSKMGITIIHILYSCFEH